MSLQIEEKIEKEIIYSNHKIDLFNLNSNTSKDYLWSEIKNSNNNKEILEDNKSLKLNIPKPKSILDSKFYLISKIGKGSSAKVYLGLSTESPIDNNNPGQLKYYSIKIMDPKKTDLITFKNEIKLLEKINQDNILKIFAYGLGQKKSFNKDKNKEPKEVYYIVMEYLEHDELLKYITNVVPGENLGFGEDFGRLIFSQLLDGLEAMHNLNIFHRDIKPNNIMIGGDNYSLKFVDFGFGTDQTGRLNSFLGTPNYAAPELHLKRPYFGKAEDIFSLGVTLFVLVTGCLPFKLAVPNDSLYQYFIKSDYVEFWTKRMVEVSPSFMELFDNMVAFDYSQRPSISEIRQSAWMKEINWDLIPYLKQEFILREEKIKINEQKIKDNLKLEISNQNKEPIFSLLETKKQIRNSVLTKDNSNKDDIDIIDNIDNENRIEINKITKVKKSKNIIQQNKGILRIKSRIKNISKLLLKIQRFLKKKGYAPIRQNFEINELEITNGEIDILLKFKSFKDKKAIIKYFKVRGIPEKFELFKKDIKLLNAKFC